jgi:hypothetical protein
MSKWRSLLLLLGILVTPLMPAAAVELSVWDFTLTYVLDGVGTAVDYQVDGLYSHVIECDTDWELVSTGSAPAVNPTDVVTYQASYSEGLFRIIERRDGTQTHTTLQCPSYSLTPVQVVAASWWDVCSGGTCPIVYLSSFISPGVTSTSEKTRYLSSPCVCAGGAQTTSAGIPYTGIVDATLYIDNFVRRHRYASTGTMVGGIYWSGRLSGRQYEPPSWPWVFIMHGKTVGPFGFGVGAGTWRVWWYESR